MKLLFIKKSLLAVTIIAGIGTQTTKPNDFIDVMKFGTMSLLTLIGVGDGAYQLWQNSTQSKIIVPLASLVYYVALCNLTEFSDIERERLLKKLIIHTGCLNGAYVLLKIMYEKIRGIIIRKRQAATKQNAKVSQLGAA